MAGRWNDVSPEMLADLLRGSAANWAIAGGWALDLWAGRQTRDHSDIEITCLRKDLSVLVERLATFEIVVARNKQLTPWPPSPAVPGPFSLWVRRHGQEQWDFEVLVEDHDDATWRYRRCPEIWKPLSDLMVSSASGLRVIRPEIQLLYKCKAPREKDIADLRVFVPMLEREARDWLAEAVRLAHPGAVADLRPLFD